MSFLHSIGAGIMVVGLFLGSLFGLTPETQAPVIQDNKTALGTALPAATANFESSLATGITSSATSLTLTSVLVRGGSTLSGYVCLTIDEGSAQAEFVCGTASSTSVTGLTRGISPADGITEVAALQFSHRRGASAKITDFPLIQRLKAQNAGEGTYESVLSYAPGVTPSGGDELVDVDYVTSVITGTSTLSYNKIVVSGTAGETVIAGSIVYLKASDSRWYLADNDLTETYVDQELGVAQGAGTSGNSISGGVLTYGLDSTQKSMTGGNFIFLSATAGATSTATTSQALGKAISATTMFFDPNIIDSSVYTSRTFSGTTTFSGAVIGAAARASTTVYTASTTWTKSSNLRFITIEVQGAGGAGGAVAAADANAGGGGGAGGYAYKTIAASLLPSTVAMAIGTAGTTTGTTTFAGFATSTGGLAGTAGTSGLAGAGGAGGTATGGDRNLTGQAGSYGYVNATADASSGKGGDSPLGFGGPSQWTTNNATGGVAATGYGAGGSGAVTSSASSASGGPATNGVIILTEYY